METFKEIYSDEELKVLLNTPNKSKRIARAKD